MTSILGRPTVSHPPNIILKLPAGGLGTIVASYLARARGSNEPELSIARVKDLQKFSRECDAYVLDHGFQSGPEHDDRIDNFRKKFENLLGNGSG